MARLEFDAFEVLTFDCYGTLIDWERGIWEAVAPLLASRGISAERDDVLVLFGELEAEAERGEFLQYRRVLARVLEGMGSRLGFEPTAAELETFARSVADWPAFPDSAAALRALKAKYALVVISNVDDDLFAASAARLGVRFDHLVTAQQVRSYKPSLNNFHQALERIGRPPTRILHVAQSLFHDIAPAASLGLRTVWVNRRHGKAGPGATPPADATPDLEVRSLEELARLAGVL
jgi:2-haloacid dehalogenase